MVASLTGFTIVRRLADPSPVPDQICFEQAHLVQDIGLPNGTWDSQFTGLQTPACSALEQSQLAAAGITENSYYLNSWSFPSAGPAQATASYITGDAPHISLGSSSENILFFYPFDRFSATLAIRMQYRLLRQGTVLAERDAIPELSIAIGDTRHWEVSVPQVTPRSEELLAKLARPHTGKTCAG